MENNPTECASLTWAQIETHYRNVADGYMAESEKLKKKAQEIHESDSKMIRLKVHLSKMATKYVVQARAFYVLADNAKDHAWQDEASERLTELESEES